MDELETHFVRQSMNDGVERPAERIGTTVKDQSASDCWPLRQPKG